MPLNDVEKIELIEMISKLADANRQVMATMFGDTRRLRRTSSSDESYCRCPVRLGASVERRRVDCRITSTGYGRNQRERESDRLPFLFANHQQISR